MQTQLSWAGEGLQKNLNFCAHCKNLASKDYPFRNFCKYLKDFSKSDLCFDFMCVPKPEGASSRLQRNSSFALPKKGTHLLWNSNHFRDINIDS